MRRYIISLAILLFSACVEKVPELQLTEESAVLDYKAGSWVTIVASGGDWTLAPADTYDWVTPSKLQGKQGEIISFKVQENLTGDSRHAEFRVLSGTQFRDIHLVQEAKPVIPIPVSKGAYKHVVILGVDGAGAFFKDTYTPRCDEIFKDGAFTYTAQAQKPTISAQNWGAILHGVLPEFHGLTNAIVASCPYPLDSPFPSIFRVAREAWPNAALASFCVWDPVNYGIIENNLGIVEGTGSDADVTQKTVDYLDKNAPTLLFVHYDLADAAGHGHGYGSAEHLQSVTTADGYIGRIYDKLKERGLLDDTLFIVCTDHGGTPGGSHGGNTQAELDVFMGVAGKTVGGDTGIQDAENRDIAAIAAYALGLEFPETWTARVPTGVFMGVEAGERPVAVLPVSEYRKHETVPTPELTDVQALLAGHEVLAYLPMDGDASDAFGKTLTSTSGKLYYYDAYFGKGLAFDDGYVTLKDVKVGMGSFSAAFWMKTNGVAEDPALLCNKDWASGLNAGFVLSLREGDIKFNAGDGVSERMDVTASLPYDFKEGWMHVILVVDRMANKVRIYEDFSLKIEGSIPAALQTTSFDAWQMNIGQDGKGTYKYRLAAQLDDFILTADVLDSAAIAALKAYYQ